MISQKRRLSGAAFCMQKTPLPKEKGSFLLVISVRSRHSDRACGNNAGREGTGACAPAVTFQVVPFSDETDSFSAMCAALGRTIDVFLITWSSAPCPEGAAFLPLGTCRCVVALSRSHPLAAKPILSWKDLAGETLLLLREGESPVVDAIRADIRRNRRLVRVLDFDGYYDMSVFNRCAQQGWLMELPELCSGIHPSLVTRPVRWSCRFPLGLMHRADPPRPVQDFLDAVRRENEIRPFRLR